MEFCDNSGMRDLEGVEVSREGNGAPGGAGRAQPGQKGAQGGSSHSPQLPESILA